MGVKHVLVFTDPNQRNLPPVITAIESLEANKVRYTVFDRVQVEPTDESLQAAIQFAAAGDYDEQWREPNGRRPDKAEAREQENQ
jgi:hydroxyacid-oxoacid transhydrogenase